VTVPAEEEEGGGEEEEEGAGWASAWASVVLDLEELGLEAE
jgi:hypothetical protein